MSFQILWMGKLLATDWTNKLPPFLDMLHVLTLSLLVYLAIVAIQLPLNLERFIAIRALNNLWVRSNNLFILIFLHHNFLLLILLIISLALNFLFRWYRLALILIFDIRSINLDLSWHRSRFTTSYRLGIDVGRLIWRLVFDYVHQWIKVFLLKLIKIYLIWMLT